MNSSIRFLFTTSILVHGLSAIAQGQTQTPPIIGYGSSDAVLPAKNQELFYMGFDLGIRLALGEDFAKKMIAVEQVSDGSQLGAVRSAKALLGKNVKMLVGFPTSHEALLAAVEATKIPILSIFSGAGHENLAKMGPYVFTTGESMTFSVHSMLDMVRQSFGDAKGLLVSNPRAIFSFNQRETALRIKSDPNNKMPNFDTAEVGEDLRLSTEIIKRLQAKEFRYIYFTQYADESSKLLQQLEDSGVDLPIVSNSSWTTGDVEFLRRLITRRKSSTYSGALWIPGNPDSLNFEKQVKKAYGREATAEMAYGYDLAQIVSQTIKLAGKNPSAEAIQKAFTQKKCFTGMTSGKMCFSPGGGHADRQVILVKFVKDRFVPIGKIGEK